MIENQIVGNIGMYYACFRLSQRKWNVMPTARNAKGVDIIAYSPDGKKYIGIQVKTLSKRNPIPVGDIDKVIGDFWLVVTNATETIPPVYIFTPSEIKGLAQRHGKSWWIHPNRYEKNDLYYEKWDKIDSVLSSSEIVAENHQTEAPHEEIEHDWRLLQDTLDQFKVKARVVNAVCGPQAIRYELELAPGAKAATVARIQSNISMSLTTPRPVRLLLPIPGKELAGIEVPRRQREIVTAQEVFKDTAWRDTRCLIPLMLGRDMEGNCVVMDLTKAPHLLVAGSTGSGKSGVMNLMILSLLQRFSPDELKLIMFDAKYLEFNPYSTLPHLISPVINEPKQLQRALQWAVDEMNRRYQLLSKARVMKLSEFNARPADTPDMTDDEGNPLPRKLPYIVIVIDELVDAMSVAKKEVKNALQILAAKSRPAGIHIIVATQRPDTHVVTGTIKNDFPWRIALQVIDAISSNVLLGQKGAESLLGQGDMLFRGDSDINRIQGAWATNEEIAAVVEACARQRPPNFDASRELTNKTTAGGDLVSRAVAVIKETKRPAISQMQRRLHISYCEAANLIQKLEDLGYIGPEPIYGLREIHWDNLP